MKIEDKLSLVEASQSVIGIKDGMFVRFYEQSLYGWQQWVLTLGDGQLPVLKVLRKKIKKLDGREVLYGGLPIESLRQAGIDVGDDIIVSLSVNVDLSGWDDWRAVQCAQTEESSEVVSAHLSEASSNRRYVRLYLPEDVVEKVKQAELLNSPLDWLLHEIKSAT
ncbi:hypothetical protein ACPV3P_08435 [Photobacterium damselae]|uniref:hypothetical protein n=1 Tax=Photobacterium damselae TaxID=38293 RepID=UPI00406808B5